MASAPKGPSQPRPSTGVHWCMCGPHRGRDLHLQLPAQGALCRPGGSGPHLRPNGEWQRLGQGRGQKPHTGNPRAPLPHETPRALPQAALGLMPEGPCRQESPGPRQRVGEELVHGDPSCASGKGHLNSQPVGSKRYCGGSGGKPLLSHKQSILVARDRPRGH